MHLLFRKNIDRYCAYCQFAGRIDEAHMICQHCGVVPCEHHCRRFRYDPLKRVPGRAKPKEFQKFKTQDFSLYRLKITNCPVYRTCFSVR